MSVINVPIELMKQYKESKREKRLLAFAIGIKLKRSNSCFTDVSAAKVSKSFKVNKNEAERLLNDAKQSPLFEYDEKRNYLRVRSFKSKEWKQSKGKHGCRYLSDYCRKISESKDCTLGRIEKIISISLVLNAVNAIERDNFTCSENNKSNRCADTKGLPLRRIAVIAGISLGAAHRLITKLVDDGVLSKTKESYLLALNTVNEDTVKEWRSNTNNRAFFCSKKDGRAYIKFACRYSIADRKVSDSLQHVIHTHKSRLLVYNTPKKYVDVFDSPQFDNFR